MGLDLLPPDLLCPYFSIVRLDGFWDEHPERRAHELCSPLHETACRSVLALLQRCSKNPLLSQNAAVATFTCGDASALLIALLIKYTLILSFLFLVVFVSGVGKCALNSLTAQRSRARSRHLARMRGPPIQDRIQAGSDADKRMGQQRNKQPQSIFFLGQEALVSSLRRADSRGLSATARGFAPSNEDANDKTRGLLQLAAPMHLRLGLVTPCSSRRPEMPPPTRDAPHPPR